MGEMFKRFCVVVALLTGCRSKQAAVANDPGTSIPLAYPVVLIGQGQVTVRDDEVSLTSASMASGLSFMERKIVDSAGAIYEVQQATTVGKTASWLRDMGTSQRRYYLELQKSRAAGLDGIKRLVIEQVESPQGVWRGDAKAIARVRGFSTVADLIAGCRTSWEWTR
jgi:hypothetical protein